MPALPRPLPPDGFPRALLCCLGPCWWCWKHPAPSSQPCLPAQHCPRAHPASPWCWVPTGTSQRPHPGEPTVQKEPFRQKKFEKNVLFQPYQLCSCAITLRRTWPDAGDAVLILQVSQWGAHRVWEWCSWVLEPGPSTAHPAWVLQSPRGSTFSVCSTSREQLQGVVRGLVGL